MAWIRTIAIEEADEELRGLMIRGRAEIVDAYRSQPPTDTIALIDMQEVGTDGVEAAFEWDAGGTGRMYLRWADDLLVELSISFTG